MFHDDPNVMAMVANPAAAGEGVSLHRICHHAIYLDRTFNAAHYLQSEDRIHRFGLPPDQDTNIEIVECGGTVDETVRERLGFKIGAMAEALDDSSLRPGFRSRSIPPILRITRNTARDLRKRTSKPCSKTCPRGRDDGSLFPGVAQGSFDLLGLVARNPVALSFRQITSSFAHFGAMRSDEILKAVQGMGWLQSDENGMAEF